MVAVGADPCVCPQRWPVTIRTNSRPKCNDEAPNPSLLIISILFENKKSVSHTKTAENGLSFIATEKLSITMSHKEPQNQERTEPQHHTTTAPQCTTTV